MNDTLTHEKFQALLNEKVQLCLGEVVLQAVIDEVSAHNRHGDAERDPFSVILVTDSNENYGQQIYTLKHAEFGELDLFLVPLGPKGDGMSYEAIVT
jgi:hypothetical protein